MLIVIPLNILTADLITDMHLFSPPVTPGLKQYSGTSISPEETFYFPNPFPTNAPFTLYANFLTWETH